MTELSFWKYLDSLLESSRLVIDRPKGSIHPHFPDFPYPYDYGYLEGTTSGDGEGIDVWVGSQAERLIGSVLVTVDLENMDSETKILLGCNEDETAHILQVHNDSDSSRAAVLVRRPLQDKTGDS